jgi:hypothetical protein
MLQVWVALQGPADAAEVAACARAGAQMPQGRERRHQGAGLEAGAQLHAAGPQGCHAAAAWGQGGAQRNGSGLPIGPDDEADRAQLQLLQGWQPGQALHDARETGAL